MAVRVSARESSREIRTAILAYKQLSRDLRRELNAEVRDFSDLWKHEIAARSRGDIDSRVFTGGARIKAGNPPVFLAANSKRKVTRSRPGIVPIRHWRGYEYGANPRRSTYARRSKNGGSHQVTRQANRHLPPPSRTGRTLGPAVRELIPMIAQRWAKMTIAKFLDALEEGR